MEREGIAKKLHLYNDKIGGFASYVSEGTLGVKVPDDCPHHIGSANLNIIKKPVIPSLRRILSGTLLIQQILK